VFSQADFGTSSRLDGIRSLWATDLRAGKVFRPNRQQTARVEITTVDVPGAASSVQSAEVGSH